jgi:hypothetical protein
MDGRIHAAVRKRLYESHGVDVVDVVAQPGMNKFLAENSIRGFWFRLILYCLTLQIRKVRSLIVMANIRSMVSISAVNHKAEVLAIVGHAECAGNKCDKETQIGHLIKARKTLESFGFEVPIILLWVGGDWKTVEVIGKNRSDSSVHSYDVRLAKANV